MANLTKTEKRIFQAAKEVFIEKGKDGAHIREIAKRAGINVSIVHYYFRSKEKLYEKVLVSELETFFNDFIDSLVETKDFQVFLQHFINSYIDRLVKNPHIIRFILSELEQGADIAFKVIQSAFERKGYTKNPLLLRIDRAITEKQIRPVDPLNFVLSIIGSCIFPIIAQTFIEKHFPGIEITSKGFLKKRKKELFDLAWKGINPP